MLNYDDAKALFKDESLNEVVRKNIYDLDERFKHVTESIADVDSRMTESVDRVYNDINGRIDEVSKWFNESMHDEVNDIRNSIENIHKDMHAARKEFYDSMDEIRTEMIKLNSDTAERIDDVLNTVDKK